MAFKQRLWVCLTCIPSRIKYLPLTITSLLGQTSPPERIFVFIPHFSRKEERPYPAADLEKCRLHSSVEIVRCANDYGPITKLLPVLDESFLSDRNVDDVAIINVDDDKIYAETLLASLYAGHLRHPTSAIGLSGWVIGHGISCFYELRPFSTPRHDAVVDWIQATDGVLYPLSKLLCCATELRKIDDVPEAKFCDDVFISGILAAFGGQQAIVVPMTSAHVSVATEARDINALQWNVTHNSGEARLADRSSVRGSLSKILMARRNWKVAMHLRKTFRVFRAPIPLPGTFTCRCVGTDVAIAFDSLIILILTLLIVFFNKSER
jgi:hypothetical protein